MTKPAYSFLLFAVDTGSKGFPYVHLLTSHNNIILQQAWKNSILLATIMLTIANVCEIAPLH